MKLLVLACITLAGALLTWRWRRQSRRRRAKLRA